MRDYRECSEIELFNSSLEDEFVSLRRVEFKKLKYVSDPANTVRIFNELEVDELIVLDIGASKKGERINTKVLQDIANECFMPLDMGAASKV